MRSSLRRHDYADREEQEAELVASLLNLRAEASRRPGLCHEGAGATARIRHTLLP
ncbi:MAG: hypothetical protein IPK24_23765 [Kineosporiaceae bacterium]|nr:hypothetical protein [Kineosporiaceae bacterium]